MKKVAFYLDDIAPNTDYFTEHSPNPGIGGTQFLIWSVACGLSERKNDLDITLFVNGKTKLPNHLKHAEVSNAIECIQLCSEQKFDYLILRSPIFDKQIVKAIEYYKVNTILWAHNFENYISYKILKKSRYIKKIVCVSKEQYNLLIDTDIFSKCTYISNGLWFDKYDISNQHENNKKTICYMGNLYPRSGYETFLKCWGKIEAAIPDCELIIIGGNDLYNTSVMKSAGYSKKSFNRIQILEQKYLYNNGKLKPNITKAGVKKGMEKLQLMAQCTVGVTNITDAGETFGLGAVEFQALGIPVVSIAKYGLLETVNDKISGILVKDKSKISDAVIDIVNNNELRRTLSEEGREFVQKNFEMSLILNKWEVFLHDVDNYFPAKKAETNSDIVNYTRNNVYFVNSILRKHIPVLPPILFYKYLIYGIRRVFEKLELV